MKAFLTETFSDEEGELAREGKTIYIRGSRQSLMELCSFFGSVAQHLKQNEACHMHFQDHAKGWAKKTHIDVSVDLDEDA